MAIALVKLIQSINTIYKRRGSWHSISTDDVAIVTGASRGLGLEIAKNLLARQCTVYNLDVGPSTYKHPSYHYVKCDLNHKDAVENAVLQILQHETVSIIVNNAGVRHSELLMELSDDRIELLFNINTLAPIWINRLVMAKAQRLYIVTVSLILGVLAPKNLSIYAATKAANIAIHEAMTQELRGNELTRLLLVLPGQLSTMMFGNIAESNPFLAPIVDHEVLAADIVHRIDVGERGVLCAPVYANFLPLVRVLPIFLQDLARWLLGMDEKIGIVHEKRED